MAELIPYLRSQQADDLNTFTNDNGPGLSLAYVTAATKNKPSDSVVGICIHLQRLPLNVSTSQMISQVILCFSKIYFRTAYGDGTKNVWSDWRVL